MPSASKKPKATRIKKENQSVSNHSNGGKCNDVKQQDDKDSDVGELSSPNLLDHNSHQSHLTGGNEKGQNISHTPAGEELKIKDGEEPSIVVEDDAVVPVDREFEIEDKSSNKDDFEDMDYQRAGMESKLTKLGGSFAVPNVQELAKEMSTTVPKRYVRFDKNDSIISIVSSSFEVPVIDMHKLDGDSVVELGKLHDACQEWGFFQLINHGVNSRVVENMKLENQEFFDLPIEEKKRFYQEKGDVEGYGQIFVRSEEQKLDWADMFYIVTSPTYLRKNHLIPKLPHTFRDAIEAYSAELKILAMKILSLMARVLKMKEEDMKILFEQGTQAMRMNYYPPCPQPELVTGFCPHSDAAGLAILVQVNEVEGLQVKKDGVWIPVVPLPHAFVVNIGDILEIVTNGAYRSVEHRAVVNTEQERLSIVTFLSPKMEGDLGPARSLVTAETPAKFKRISVSDYFKGFFTRELVGKSYLDSMRA